MARLNVESITATTITVDGRELLAFEAATTWAWPTTPPSWVPCARAWPSLASAPPPPEKPPAIPPVHDKLEQELAAFLHQEAAILLAEGYTANIAVAQALCRHHGVALIDARAHRSLRSAATAAGMQVFEYEHLNADSASWLVRQYGDQGIAIFTDGVFAADGRRRPQSQTSSPSSPPNVARPRRR